MLAQQRVAEHGKQLEFAHARTDRGLELGEHHVGDGAVEDHELHFLRRLDLARIHGCRARDR